MVVTILNYNCLVCDKPLQVCTPSQRSVLISETGGYNAISGGVICETTGNYGSAVFDAYKGEKIAFCICDECLFAKSDKVEYMVLGKIRPISEFKQACSGSFPQEDNS